MAYLTQTRLQAVIPAAILNDALDDDRDGIADEGLLAEILDAASDAVDALICGRFTVPINTAGTTETEKALTALAGEAALAFACEMVAARRPTEDRNPYAKAAQGWRERLARIGAGQESVIPAASSDAPASWGGATYQGGRLSSEE